jgi:hypothetical protein
MIPSGRRLLRLLLALMRIATLLDAEVRAFSGQAAGFATKGPARATILKRKRRRGQGRGGVPFGRGREIYLFLPAGFLAFALPADFATLAFFFAAIVSTSPDIGMNKSSASIRKIVNRLV